MRQLQSLPTSCARRCNVSYTEPCEAFSNYRTWSVQRNRRRAALLGTDGREFSSLARGALAYCVGVVARGGQGFGQCSAYSALTEKSLADHRRLENLPKALCIASVRRALCKQSI